MVNLGPNLREFRFDCDVQVTDAIAAFEALKYLKNVEVLGLGLLFRLCFGEDEADFDWLKHFPHSGNLREFIVRARYLDSVSPRYEGIERNQIRRISFLDKSPQLQALASQLF